MQAKLRECLGRRQSMRPQTWTRFVYRLFSWGWCLWWSSGRWLSARCVWGPGLDLVGSPRRGGLWLKDGVERSTGKTSQVVRLIVLVSISKTTLSPWGIRNQPVPMFWKLSQHLREVFQSSQADVSSFPGFVSWLYTRAYALSILPFGTL